jgi:hypothetical protein
MKIIELLSLLLIVTITSCIDDYDRTITIGAIGYGGDMVSYIQLFDEDSVFVTQVLADIPFVTGLTTPGDTVWIELGQKYDGTLMTIEGWFTRTQIVYDGGIY